MDVSVERALAIVAKREEKRKDIHLPTLDTDITIKKVQPYDYYVMGVSIPTEIDASGERVAKQTKEFISDNTRVYFARGVVSPRVQLDEDKPLASDEIYISDLADDFDFIISEISVLSGFKEAADNAAVFPQEEQEAEPSAGSDSEEIRGAPA